MNFFYLIWQVSLVFLNVKQTKIFIIILMKYGSLEYVYISDDISKQIIKETIK